MRKWLLNILIISFLWIVASRLTEVEKLAVTLSAGRLPWILAAVLLQIAYHLVYTALYQVSFRTVGVNSRFRELLPVLFASLFVNVAAPSGGTSGAAVFVSDAAHRGESPAKAAAGSLLVTITELGSFLVILLAGMYYLFTHHSLETFEVVSAGILVVFVSGLSTLLMAGLWRPNWIERLLGFVSSLSNRVSSLFTGRDVLSAEWARSISTEFTEAADAVRQNPGKLGQALGIAALAHTVDLACLYALFQAFSQPVGFGVLVAGYSMAILFLVVSPTPQGMGVVEAVLIMVFVSLGVPGSKAALVSLLFRGLSFWIPLLVGAGLIRRLRSFRGEEEAQAKAFEVHIVAAAAAVLGLIDILSAVTPSLAHRIAFLEPFLSSATRHGFRLASLLAGFGLIMISRSLWKRKKAAWTITLMLLVTSLIGHLIKGLDFEEAGAAVIMVVWLWRLRRHYQVPSDPPSVMQGVRVMIVSLSLTAIYGTLGFFLLDRHFSVHYGFAAALEQTLTMFLEFYDPGLEPISGFGRYFANSIYIVGLTSAAWSLLLVLRPVFIRHPASKSEYDRAKRIVEDFGRSSLAAMALLPDKSFHFTQGGSVIAFVTESGIGLALGDPIGPASDAAAAIADFRGYCAAHGWKAVFYQTLPDYLELYKDSGFSTICVGREAIVDVRTFSIDGGEMKSVRASVRKLVRMGFTAEMLQPPLSEEHLEQLRLISDEWLAERDSSEKRFSLGWFDEEYVRSCPVMVVKSEDGTVTSFANVVSEYARNEMTVDLMRRRSDSPGGTMDFLFVKLFEWAAAARFDTFNLGLSPLAGVGDDPGDPAVEKAMKFVYEHMNHFYSFKGLHDFKDKFRPEWSPRYLVYEGPASLLGTAYAIVRADSGSGLIASHFGRRFRRA